MFILWRLFNSHRGKVTITPPQDQEALKQHYIFIKWLSVHEPKATGFDPQIEFTDESIITSYAAKNNISVSDDELQNAYQQALKSVGTEDQYLAKLKEIRGFDKQTILEKMKIDLLKQKVQKATGVPIELWLEEQRQKNNQS